MENKLKSAWLKFDDRYKIIVIASLIIGVFSHGMALFNKYSVHDDVGAMFWTGTTFPLGRWALDIFGRVETAFFGDGHYSLPLYNGIVSILCIAIVTCIMCSLLEINNKVLCVLLSGFMVSFSTITAIFSFMFTAHYYMIAFLLGIVGVYLICKYKKWYCWVIGVCVVAFSIGVYQAFIPIYISLMLMSCVNMSLEKNVKIIEIFKEGIRLVLSIISYTVLYAVLNKIFLKINHTELKSYKGIDSVGSVPIKEYLFRTFLRTYKEFLYPRRQIFPHRSYWVYIIILSLLLFIAVVLTAKLFIKKKSIAFSFIALLFIFPIACEFIYVMCDKNSISSLMLYGAVMPMWLLADLMERVEWKKIKVSKIYKICVVVSFVILNIMFIRFNNRCYLKAELYQQEAISYFTTLITQIKSCDGYDPLYPVLFADDEGNTDPSITLISELEDIQINDYHINLSIYLNNYTYKDFIRRWCGYSPYYIDFNSFDDKNAVLAMPKYPCDGSIKIIDDVVVVRF